MNYFTTEYAANKTVAQKRELVAQDGGCKHVTRRPELTVTVHYERDTWGPVSSHAVCQVCEDKIKQQQQEELHVCHDCKQEIPRKDGIKWNYYDAIVSDGDEPLFICKCCVGKQNHINRVNRDKAAYEDEFGVRDDDEVGLYASEEDDED